MLDPRIHTALLNEGLRQANTIELIASENYTSQAVMDLCGSILTNKYAEGLPGKRYYNGCEHVDDIERTAIEYATRLFGCGHANVQPHSGANANLAVFKAFLKPSDCIVGMDLASGGHLSHGAKVNASGAWFESHSYGVNARGLIDYDAVAEFVEFIKPQMVIAGASSYSQVIDWARFREIADSVGAILLADVAHYSGLIAGGEYPSPFPHAHVVTTTTHKGLRGPRGGLILWDDPDHSKKINSAVFPGTQGGPLMHIIAGKAQCFYEALQPEFKLYAKRVRINAHAMAQAFIDAGVDVVSGGTQCHMFTVDLRKEKLSGREYADLLEANGITVNKNGVPGETRSFTETSGVRVGVAAETTRGHDEAWFKQLATKMIAILQDGN
ncbi:serine hydroxymethyltransferase [Haliscomenobacter sp.]|uniref:serine hydroxymethyltransferase n=1 Tax=Haliscomenobacter sp. TaxID=2717303 RepID=UPI003364F996